MSFERASKFLQSQGYGDRIIVLKDSSATVAEAATALGTDPDRIAKTLSFLVEGRPILIVTAGEARIDNHKYKEFFHAKAKMIPPEEVEALTGHAPGGVCPFGRNEGIPVYLDRSMLRYEFIYPAAGDDHSAVKLTPQELQALSAPSEWIDAAKEAQQ